LLNPLIPKNLLSLGLKGLREEIFAEETFADFVPIREIRFFFLSLRKECQNGREMKVRMSKIFV